MIVLLHDVDDVELVLRKHLGEAVCVLYLPGDLRRFVGLGIAHGAAVENVRAHPQGLGHLTRDRQRVARHHLDLDAHLGRRCDGRLCIDARGVEERQHPEQSPNPVDLGSRDAQRAKTARGEVVHGLIDCVLHGRRVLAQALDDLRGALGHLEGLAVGALHRRLGALVHGIERYEVRDLIGL